MTAGNQSPQHPKVSLDNADQKALLKLLCAADRTRLRLLARPRPKNPISSGIARLNDLLSLARILPGKAGRIARLAGLGINVLRTFFVR